MNEEAELLLRCRHCFVRVYFLNGEWRRKIRCLRCPLCASSTQSPEPILTGVGDGWEICSNPSCNYRRLVFSDQEIQQLGW